MEEPFETEEDLQKWLVEERNVPVPVAVAVARTLKDVGYVYPSSLLNITQANLQGAWDVIITLKGLS